nr:hypothetical protein [Tanacetum cinerariifolium]
MQNLPLEHLFSMGYEHFNTTLVTELDEVAESSIKNLVPIPREYEVTLDNESESNEPVKDDSLAFTTFLNPLFNDKDDVTIHKDDVPIEESKVHSNPFFDNDETNSDELESHVESNFVESLSNHDHLGEISEPLIPIHIPEEERIKREHAEHISQIDIVTNTDGLLPPGFENDESDGEVDVVEELHVDNSISNSENELFDNEESDFDNPSVSRPPPEPPDVEFKPYSKEEILVVMNTIDELECHNPIDELDDDYFSFMFLSIPRCFFLFSPLRVRIPSLTLVFPFRASDNKHKNSTRRSVHVETTTSKALVSCDSIGEYDWSDQAEEGYKNYNAVPPPYIGNFMPPTPDLSYTGLDEFVNKPVVEICKAKSYEEETKAVRKNNDALIIKEWVSDDEE